MIQCLDTEARNEALTGKTTKFGAWMRAALPDRAKSRTHSYTNGSSTDKERSMEGSRGLELENSFNSTPGSFMSQKKDSGVAPAAQKKTVEEITPKTLIRPDGPGSGPKSVPRIEGPPIETTIKNKGIDETTGQAQPTTEVEISVLGLYPTQLKDGEAGDSSFSQPVCSDMVISPKKKVNRKWKRSARDITHAQVPGKLLSPIRQVLAVGKNGKKGNKGHNALSPGPKLTGRISKSKSPGKSILPSKKSPKLNCPEPISTSKIMATRPSIFIYPQNLIPIFEGDNYDFWSIQMKTLFMSHDLWEIVERGYTAPGPAQLTADQLRNYEEDKKSDARALLFIQQEVSKTIFPRIVNAVTSKEAWEILKTEFQGSERIINNQEIRDFELMDSLYSAAADGDFSKFEDHSNRLEQILTPNGNTILHIHITARQPRRPGISQNMNFVTRILDNCPELIWKANKRGETLLHMAARHGHADVANYLLEECRNSYQNDQEPGIRAKRQMLQMINEAKDTALHEAVRYNHIDVVVQLLTDEDRELPYDSNNDGETPLYLAAERGCKEILRKILDTCNSPADHGPNSRTALHATVIRNDEGKLITLSN
ncbi:hypothetical protein LWI29_022108 [Acer saccharum]|uniref:DUF4219 domain-containing protein n=1 Tax=Acer saccharum TaxID=4024 RepID=A0AA39TFY1_ACESA|nr:hypothetical protein LWI29_022108 [Acer saccharum]